MMHPQGSANGKEGRSSRYAKSMRTRSTRLAGSIRDRVIATSFVTSSSPIDNPTTSRGAAMMQSLVQRNN
jgi:hypothetical protein